MAHTGHEKAAFEKKVRQVQAYLDFIQLDPQTTSQIIKYYEFRFANKNDTSKIVHELPTKLRTEVVLHRFGKTVQVVPFFLGLAEVSCVAASGGGAQGLR